MSRSILCILFVGLCGNVVHACPLCEATGLQMAHADQMASADQMVSVDVPPPEPQGYTLAGGKWSQPGGLGTPVTITYSYNNLLDGGLKRTNGKSLPEHIIRASVEEALGLWASVAPLHFVEVPDQHDDPPPNGSYPNGQFGQIRFHHIRINGPDIPGQPPMAKAQAYYPSNSGNLAGDVYYDHDDPWGVSGTLPVPDVLGATIHEVGHALGLGHSSLPEANMYWIFTRYNGPGTNGALHPDDINGIRAVYGAGVGSVTSIASTQTPEPATWVLAAIGAIVLFWIRRRS